MSVRFVAARLLHAVIALLGVLTVIFILGRIVPGDPAQLLLGLDATPERLQAVRQEYGLDEPLWAQYLDFMARVVRLDFGMSYQFQTPAVDLIGARLANTAYLAFAAIVLAAALAFPTGILAGLRSLALVEAFCDRMYVMKSGRIVESGDTERICNDPQDAYTRRLLAATLRLER